MKRELKKAISTIRKIQDAVFNICTERSMSIDCTNYEGRQWWTIFAHNKSTREKCEMWQIHEGDDYERIITEITNYLNKQ